jgi:ParB/RepB/Spo0J family partition protein
MSTRKPYAPKDRDHDGEHSLNKQPSRDPKAVIIQLDAISIPENIRSNPEGIEELAASIAQSGLLQPLVLRKTVNGFELVAGQRRFAALRQLGATDAPARVINADQEQIAVLRLIENIQRQDLSGVDEVRAVSALLPLFDGNQSAVARAIGRDQSYVSRCVRAAHWILENPTYATSHSSKSMLFELVEAKDPLELARSIQTGETNTISQARKRSGPVSGGRYVEGAIQYRERSSGNAFSLRINFDQERTPSASREKIIETLETILAKLRAS